MKSYHRQINSKRSRSDVEKIIVNHEEIPLLHKIVTDTEFNEPISKDFLLKLGKSYGIFSVAKEAIDNMSRTTRSALLQLGIEKYSQSLDVLAEAWDALPEGDKNTLLQQINEYDEELIPTAKLIDEDLGTTANDITNMIANLRNKINELGKDYLMEPIDPKGKYIEI